MIERSAVVFCDYLAIYTSKRLAVTERFWVQMSLSPEKNPNGKKEALKIPVGGFIVTEVIKFMKFEILDAVVIVLALFMLAAYFKLQATIFVLVFAVLIIAEIFVQIRFRKGSHEIKEPESMP